MITLANHPPGDHEYILRYNRIFVIMHLVIMRADCIHRQTSLVHTTSSELYDSQ